MQDTDVDVKGYAYSADALAELEATLSAERFTTYLCAVGGDKQLAARLYTWNTAVSAAFYGPLQALEVAVRNSMHTNLTVAYGADWYDNQATALIAGRSRRLRRQRAICNAIVMQLIRLMS